MLVVLIPLLIASIPLIWLAVAAMVVTACQVAARADGGSLAQSERRDWDMSLERSSTSRA